MFDFDTKNRVLSFKSVNCFLGKIDGARFEQTSRWLYIIRAYVVYRSVDTKYMRREDELKALADKEVLRSLEFYIEMIYCLYITPTT